MKPFVYLLCRVAAEARYALQSGARPGWRPFVDAFPSVTENRGEIQFRWVAQAAIDWADHHSPVKHWDLFMAMSIAEWAIYRTADPVPPS